MTNTLAVPSAPPTTLLTADDWRIRVLNDGEHQPYIDGGTILGDVDVTLVYDPGCPALGDPPVGLHMRVEDGVRIRSAVAHLDTFEIDLPAVLAAVTAEVARHWAPAPPPPPPAVPCPNWCDMPYDGTPPADHIHMVGDESELGIELVKEPKRRLAGGYTAPAGIDAYGWIAPGDTEPRVRLEVATASTNGLVPVHMTVAEARRLAALLTRMADAVDTGAPPG